jgi:hypothetical protein
MHKINKEEMPKRKKYEDNFANQTPEIKTID